MTDLPDRTRQEWRVEALELDGTWQWVSSSSDTPELAHQKRDVFLARFPDADTRIVRFTTTYTVEDDHGEPAEPHRCHQDPAWHCDGGYEFGPCRETNPGDNCPDPDCNRYNGRCPCNCHQKD